MQTTDSQDVVLAIDITPRDYMVINGSQIITRADTKAYQRLLDAASQGLERYWHQHGNS